MRLVNLTPHPIRVIPGPGDEVALTLPPSGTCARVATRTYPAGSLVVDGGATVPVVTAGVHEPEVTDLPAPVRGTCYVVSRLVFDAAPDRTDLLVPDDLVRDADGAVVGCRRFSARVEWCDDEEPHWLVVDTYRHPGAVSVQDGACKVVEALGTLPLPARGPERDEVVPRVHPGWSDVGTIYVAAEPGSPRANLLTAAEDMARGAGWYRSPTAEDWEEAASCYLLPVVEATVAVVGWSTAALTDA